MPTVMRVGRFHPDSDEVALAFSFDCDGVAGEVYTRVREERFGKHVHWLDDYSICPQGRRHTAVQPKSLARMRGLYEDFSRDLVREFLARGAGPVWIELAYQRQELRVELGGLDVAGHGAALPYYGEVVVGANVSKVSAGSGFRQNPLRDAQTG